MAPSVECQFDDVAWEEPPDEQAASNEPTESRSDASGGRSEPEGLAASAAETFRTVAWEEQPNEYEVDEATANWSEKMKLSNFFENAGW